MMTFNMWRIESKWTATGRWEFVGTLQARSEQEAERVAKKRHGGAWKAYPSLNNAILNAYLAR